MEEPKQSKPITVTVEIKNLRMDSAQAKKEIREAVTKKVNDIIDEWEKQWEKISKEETKFLNDVSPIKEECCNK